jgi:hypothetical protein
MAKLETLTWSRTWARHNCGARTWYAKNGWCRPRFKLKLVSFYLAKSAPLTSSYCARDQATRMDVQNQLEVKKLARTDAYLQN